MESCLVYFVAFLNMFLESSFFPFPSEPFVLYLGYLINSKQVDFFITYFFLIFGSLSGALMNYYLAKRYGLKFFKNWIEVDIIKKALKNFKENQCFYTFIFRFIPLLRQIMSIPAGIIRMDLKKFVLYSLLGILIWNFVLLYLCTVVTDPIVLKRNLLIFGVLALVLLFFYILFKNKIKKFVLKIILKN